MSKELEFTHKQLPPQARSSSLPSALVPAVCVLPQPAANLIEHRASKPSRPHARIDQVRGNKTASILA